MSTRNKKETGLIKQCTECQKQFKRCIIKLGGLLCPSCRTILYLPSSPEYKYELQDRKLKNV